MTYMFSLSECYLSVFLMFALFSLFTLFFFLFFRFPLLSLSLYLSISLSIPSSAALTWKDTKLNIERKNGLITTWKK